MGYLCVERTIHVPLEKVWPVAGDFTKPPAPNLSVEIVKNGDPSKLGAGCERKIRSGKAIYHERLTSVNPPNAYSYEMLSGSPAKYQRGKVEFASSGDSTHIKWSVEFAPKYPGIGWIFRIVLRNFYNKLIDEMEKIK